MMEQTVVFNSSDNMTESEQHLTHGSETNMVGLALAALMCFAIMTVGIIGNGSVIWVICTYRSMRQAVMNVYILNVAVADLLYNLLNIPEIVQFILDDGWQLGYAACKGMRYAMLCCLYVSILSMLAVAFERYVAIIFPVQAHALLSKQRIMTGIISIWFLSASCATPVLIFNGFKSITGNKIACVMLLADNFKKHHQRKTIYKFIEFALFYALPLVVQIVLYTLITKKLRESTKRLKISIDNSRNSASQTSALVNHKNSQTENWKSSNTMQSRRNVVKMLVACISVYFISHSPIQVMLFYDTFADAPFQATWGIRVVLIGLILINSAANPIIYCICSESYRSKFKVIYRCEDERTRRARRLKSSVRSGESMKTVQTSSFKMSNIISGGDNNAVKSS